MCGILGTIPSTNSKIFDSALHTLFHRGPDSGDTWHSNDASLGHRRLAILDITDSAKQPMGFNDRYHITFNGEIYNFVELKEELVRDGFKFKTSSDTEVLLYSFVKWGEGCVKRLNGMWAFGIWDSLEKKLFLSRDRMGEKPLFYAFEGKKFIFASEQKAILPFLKITQKSRNFNKLVENPYLYEGTADSLFDKIYRFPAASNGFLLNGKLKICRYWNLIECKSEAPNSYQDQVGHLRSLLHDAIKIRMRSDVPIGTGLSGGIDSSTIAAFISKTAQSGGKRIASNWQNAFTVTFPGTVMDEVRDARHVARHLNINLNEVSIDTSTMIKDITEYPYMFEEIHEVNPIPHIQLYRNMRENGILVTLDGHGGDELFSGYESSILHALPTAILNKKRFREILSTYRNIHPNNAHFEGMRLPAILLYLIKSSFSQRRRLRNKFNQNLSTKFDSLNMHLLDLTFCTILPTLLRNYDRYSMMSGVEIRIPFLDHRIVEFAFSIGSKSKIRNGYSKSILRDLSQNWIPSTILQNKRKIGFAPPITDWLRGPLREFMLDEIRSLQFSNSCLIDPKKLRANFESIILNKNAKTLYEVEKSWKLFSIFLWEKAFLKGEHRSL